MLLAVYQFSQFYLAIFVFILNHFSHQGKKFNQLRFFAGFFISLNSNLKLSPGQGI